MDGPHHSDRRHNKPAASSVLRGFDREEFARARIHAQLTVQELGKQSRVDRAAIHRWESGECLPLVDSLSRATAALGVSIEQFLNVPESERTLADLRAMAGFTQAELAQRAGMSRRVLGSYERGRGRMDPQRAAALAGALKVSEATIWDAHGRSVSL